MILVYVTESILLIEQFNEKELVYYEINYLKFIHDLIGFNRFKLIYLMKSDLTDLKLAYNKLVELLYLHLLLFIHKNVKELKT